MAIRVEFYGIARQRAGIAEMTLDMPAAGLRFGDALCEIARRLPQMDCELVRDSRLHASLAANLDGAHFISDPDTPISDGQCLLILSADAGG